jgi:hypothetical protein
MKSRVLLCLLAFSLFEMLSTFQARAVEYIRISGVVQNATPNPGSVFVRFWLQGQFGGNILADTEVKGSGNYSVLVPKNTPVDIALMSYSDGFTNFAGWKRATTYTQDTVLNFNIPLGLKVSGRIVDAQGKQLGNAFVNMNEFNSPMDPIQISSDGNLWTGYGQSQMVKADSSGNFELYSYSTKSIGFKRTLVVEGSGTPGYRWVSAKQVIDGPKQFVVCIPINFGSTLTLPNYCSEDEIAYASRVDAEIKAKQEAEAKAAAELKAKQEAEAKAAAELKAKQEAEAKAAAELKAKQDAEAKAAAELKAKQEAEAKAAAELKAKQEAEAKAAADKVICDANRAQLLNVQASLLTAIKSYPKAAVTLSDTRLRLQTALSASCIADVTLNDFRSEVNSVIAEAKKSSVAKLTTITCAKGKVVKKVTAVNPKCPSGYKKR